MIIIKGAFKIMDKVKVVGWRNEGFFKIPLAVNNDGRVICLYRPDRIVKKDVDK